MVIDAIKKALEKMDKRYCKLSTIDYHKLDESFRENLPKYLERPFAYEFYHQLRKLIDDGEVDFGGPIVQAEVDKRYQHCFRKGKIPDFIIHIPNTNINLAVIEFKLTSNISRIEEDFKKLVKFKQKRLNYEYLVEVIIDDCSCLKKAREHIKEISTDNGEKIIIVEFNTQTWKADEWEIKYKPKSGKAESRMSANDIETREPPEVKRRW